MKHNSYADPEISKTMLGKFSKFSIIEVVRIGHQLRIVPFRGSIERNAFIVEEIDKVHIGSKSVDLLGFKMMTVILTFNNIFQFLRIVQSLLYLDLTGQEIIFQVIIFGVSSLTSVIQINNFFHPDEVAEGFTAFFQNEENLTSIIISY